MNSDSHLYVNTEEKFDDSTHVIVKFYVESYEEDVIEIADAIAGESSFGISTVKDVHTGDLLGKFGAKVFEINELTKKSAFISVAYPLVIFEFDNIPQLLSVIAGNSFGIRGIKYIKVLDIDVPQYFVRSNIGPAFGVQGIREMIRVFDRPLVSAVVKPKVGLSPKEFADAAFEAWIGGADVVLDDENMVDQDQCPFYERVNRVIEARRRAENKTGERKLYFPNISARLSEMYARGKYVREIGGRGVMVDVLTVGFSGIQFIREQELGVIIHGHRSLPTAFTQLEHHGISMLVIAKISRLAGIDQLHTGTVYKREGNQREEVLGVTNFLKRYWYGIRPVMPFESGGLTADVIPSLQSVLGKDIIYNVGSGIFECPEGIQQGARRVRRAIEARSDVTNQDATTGNKKIAKHTYTHSLALSRGLGLLK